MKVFVVLSDNLLLEVKTMKKKTHSFQNAGHVVVMLFLMKTK